MIASGGFLAFLLALSLHVLLYPALNRLEDRGWVDSYWDTSENNRRARYYRLTPKGRAQLAEQTSRWDEIVRAVNRIMRPAGEPQ